MLAHLRTDAWLAVLLGSAVIMICLRTAVTVCKRALVARDERCIAAVTRTHATSGTGSIKDSVNGGD